MRVSIHLLAFLVSRFEICFEQITQICRIHTDTIILHFDLYAESVSIDTFSFDHNFNYIVGKWKFDSVAEQIQQNLLNSHLIHWNFNLVAARNKFNGDVSDWSLTL